MKTINLSEELNSDFLEKKYIEYSDENLTENEYVIVNDHIAIYREMSLNLCPIQPKSGFPIALPKNNFPYIAAINACIDPKIPIVCLHGAAGTGKTVIALASIIHMWRSWPDLELIFVKENVQSTDHPLGFTPGTLSEKKKPIFQYLASVLEFLDNKTITGEMRIETLAYLLGETFYQSYVIVDEAQNLTEQNIDLLATRIGKKTKMIFIGDDAQNYNKKRTETGLKYLKDVMTGSPAFTEVHLTDSTLRSWVVQEYLKRKKAYYDKG